MALKWADFKDHAAPPAQLLEQWHPHFKVYYVTRQSHCTFPNKNSTQKFSNNRVESNEIMSGIYTIIDENNTMTLRLVG